MVSAYTDREKDEIVSGLQGKVTVQRSKGLGENEPEMMKLTTMDPATRRVLPVRVRADAEEATRNLFSLLMGKSESANRRAWMEEKGNRVEADV